MRKLSNWIQFIRESIDEDRYVLLYYNEYGEDFDEYGINIEDAVDTVGNIAKEGGVRVLRDMQLSSILIDRKETEVIGGVWVTDHRDTFSFDIALDKRYHNKGLSNLLIRRSISEYREQKDMYDDMGEDFEMEVDVINPILAHILKDRFGFYVIRKLGKDRVLMTLD